MRPSALAYMYARRLRAHWVQETLAALGIAIAVALVLSATVAERSISGSAHRVLATVVGPAQLQLRARSERGLAESMLTPVQRLPGVERAAPLLELSATVSTPAGRALRLRVAGADLRLATLDGLAETLPLDTLGTNRIALTQASADALGANIHALGTNTRALGGNIRALGGNTHALGASARARKVNTPLNTPLVTLKLRGNKYTLPLSTTLDARSAGALAGADAAVMPLRLAQRLAGLPGRVSRILVQARPGQVARVRAELQRLATPEMEVSGAQQDLALLRQALGPSDLASGLFAAIGALLGFLLAFNAMLLTVADRRRAIADLRIEGATRASVTEMVLFEALCLGVVGSLAGIAAGWGLATVVFHQSTGYLAEAFVLSPATLLEARALALALGGGVLAACLAGAVPLLDLRRGRARDAVYRGDGAPGNTLARGESLRLGWLALGLSGAATLLWTLAPGAAIPATALLALATVAAVPLVFAAVLRAAALAAEHLQRPAILPLALASLRATTVRSLALAATGAVALFGSVALGGARENLLQGIKGFARSYVADADVWVGNPGDNQAVESFRAGALPQRLAQIPSVASVRSFQGAFLQLGSRRVWIIARPPGGARHVLATQLRSGTAALADSRLARSGWAVVSEAIAAERHLRIGDALTLATPTGARTLRVAATSTNLAWPPGVVFMSQADFARDWGSSEPTALAVTLAADVRPGGAAGSIGAGAARRQIARALAGSGLEVTAAADRAARIDALAGSGLGQLRQISLLLLLAATLAMAAALSASIWARRAGLAGLRLLGARSGSVAGVLALEALLMLGAGCLTGALAGLYGQVVIDAFLRHVTGFPLADPTTSARPLEIFAAVLATALAIGAVPGWLATRVRPALALAGE
jgi:putative ABC transport system permease protein